MDWADIEAELSGLCERGVSFVALEPGQCRHCRRFEKQGRRKGNICMPCRMARRRKDLEAAE
jgi:hypothetical protein